MKEKEERSMAVFRVEKINAFTSMTTMVLAIPDGFKAKGLLC